MRKRDFRLERKRQRWEENKLFILEAAERVFSRKGYNLATMDDVAEEAQFSKATIYRYFQSKRDILTETILNFFEDVEKKMRDIHKKKTTARQKLKDITRFQLQFFHQKKNISRVLLMEKSLMKTILHVSPEDHQQFSKEERRFLENIRTSKERCLEIMSEILEEGIKNGEFRRMNPHDAARAFEAMLHGFYFTKFWDEKEYNLDSGTDLIHKFFLNGIKKGRHA